MNENSLNESKQKRRYNVRSKTEGKHRNVVVPESVDIDQEFINRIISGIIQNILNEINKQNLTYRQLDQMSGVDYSRMSNIFSGKRRLTLTDMIRFAYALGISPVDLFPYDCNLRRSFGQRFDDITKELDLAGRNYCLEMCMNYCKERRRVEKI